MLNLLKNYKKNDIKKINTLKNYKKNDIKTLKDTIKKDTIKKDTTMCDSYNTPWYKGANPNKIGYLPPFSKRMVYLYDLAIKEDKKFIEVYESQIFPEKIYESFKDDFFIYCSWRNQHCRNNGEYYGMNINTLWQDLPIQKQRGEVLTYYPHDYRVVMDLIGALQRSKMVYAIDKTFSQFPLDITRIICCIYKKTMVEALLKLTTELTHISREQEYLYMNSWNYYYGDWEWVWIDHESSHVSISWKDWKRSIDILKKKEEDKKKKMKSRSNKYALSVSLENNLSGNTRKYISDSQCEYISDRKYISKKEWEHKEKKMMHRGNQYASSVLFKKYRKDIMLKKNKSFRNTRKNMRGKKTSR